MWVYWYPPISNLLQGHDIDPSNSSACSKQPGVRNRTSLHSMGQPSNTYWVDVETCMLKHAETCWNMLKLWISASICTGLSHLEDLAPKKKTHSADSAGQIFQRSRKSVKRLSAKFTSTWGPAPHMMGTLTKQSGSSWTWAEGSYSSWNFEQSFHRGKAGAGTWSELETPKEIQDISVTCPKPEIHRISYWAKGLFK